MTQEKSGTMIPHMARELTSRKGRDVRAADIRSARRGLLYRSSRGITIGALLVAGIGALAVTELTGNLDSTDTRNEGLFTPNAEFDILFQFQDAAGSNSPLEGAEVVADPIDQGELPEAIDRYALVAADWLAELGRPVLRPGTEDTSRAEATDHSPNPDSQEVPEQPINFGSDWLTQQIRLDQSAQRQEFEEPQSLEQIADDRQFIPSEIEPESRFSSPQVVTNGTSFLPNRRLSPLAQSALAMGPPRLRAGEMEQALHLQEQIKLRISPLVSLGQTAPPTPDQVSVLDESVKQDRGYEPDIVTAESQSVVVVENGNDAVILEAPLSYGRPLLRHDMVAQPDSLTAGLGADAGSAENLVATNQSSSPEQTELRNANTSDSLAQQTPVTNPNYIAKLREDRGFTPEEIPGSANLRDLPPRRDRPPAAAVAVERQPAETLAEASTKPLTNELASDRGFVPEVDAPARTISQMLDVAETEAPDTQAGVAFDRPIEIGLGRPLQRPGAAEDFTPVGLTIGNALGEVEQNVGIVRVASVSPVMRPKELEGWTLAVARPKNRPSLLSAPPAPTPSPQRPEVVASKATQKGVIDLNDLNLIGVYGTADNRVALVRMKSGNFRRISVGSRVDGGRVIAISENSVTYVKRNRNFVLRMPR